MSTETPIDWRSIVVMLVFCRIFPDPFIIGGAAICITYMLCTHIYTRLTLQRQRRLWANGGVEATMMAEKNMNGRGQTYEMGTQWMFAPILFCIAAATSTEIAAAIGCGCIIAYILNNLIARARVHVIRKRLGWRLNLAEMVIK